MKETLNGQGFIKLVTQMGGDQFVVEAARIGRQSDKPWRQTLRYMMRHGHTSPFEFVVFVFHVRLPIFVARQWMRHRACTFNEWSARYMELPDKHWMPREWRGQAKTNRQSSTGTVPYEFLLFDGLGSGSHGNRAEEVAEEEYQNRLAQGVAREQARSCLPVSTFTEFYWKIDLHNLLHFLRLRNDPHAQAEIREYAEAIENILALQVPETYNAWLEFVKNTVTLTQKDLDVIARGKDAHFDSVSEFEEHKERLIKAGFVVPIGKPNFEIVDKK